MNVVEIIKKKRNKKALSEDEINFIISKYTNREIPDYQMSAFLMAGFINGFSSNETSWLTKAMLFSGKVLNFDHLEGKKIDKHSTGGNYIGNWLEVLETIEILRDGKKNDLTELSLILSGIMIYLGGKSKSIDDGIELSIRILNSGEAYEKFMDIVKAQGGDFKLLLNPDNYPNSKFTFELKSNKKCFIKEIDTYQVGMAALELGAGRLKKEDKIDFKAGIKFYPEIGEEIKKGEVIFELFSDSQEKIEKAKLRMMKALTFSETKTNKKQLIKKLIS